MDSAVLAWRLLMDGATVQPVYVLTGMAWETVEMGWLLRYLAAIAAPRLLPLRMLAFPLDDVYAAHWSVSGQGTPAYDSPDEAVYLPGRNIILLAKTAVFCALNGFGRIASGVLAGNPFPDATDDFFATLGRGLSLGLATPIAVERPFAALHKVDVVRLGASLPLELSFSCIHPVGELHCGDCNKCAERQQGFADARVEDRTMYAVRQRRI